MKNNMILELRDKFINELVKQYFKSDNLAAALKNTMKELNEEDRKSILKNFKGAINIGGEIGNGKGERL